MFGHPKFEVEICIERVTHIPYYSGTVFVRWNVAESPRPDAHGRTVSRPINDAEASFRYHTKFKQRIGLRSPSKLLKNCTIKFEVVWEPAGGRGVTIGALSLDLAQFTKPSNPDRYDYQEDLLEDQPVTEEALHHKDDPKADHKDEHDHKGHHHKEHQKDHHKEHQKDHSKDQENVSKSIGEVYDRPLLYLLSGAKNNSLLDVKIKLDHVHGESDYRVPPFDGPAVNLAFKVNPELDGKTAHGNGGAPGSNRVKLRQLREAVLQDLMKEDHSRNNTESDWLDIDQFLMGKHVRATPTNMDEEFEKYGIREVSDLEFETHKPGTPFLETEVRDNFINWNVVGI